MSEPDHTRNPTPPEAAFDLIHPSGEHTRILLNPLPFRIGRGPENHLVLRDNRASRTHSWILPEPDPWGQTSYIIEDLASTHGTWINNRRINGPVALQNGDTVHFGFEDSYRLIFVHSPKSISQLLDVFSQPPADRAAAGLARLRALVEMARVLQTSTAVDEVLAAVVDTAMAVTGAERGFLLLRTEEGLALRVGRGRNGAALFLSDLGLPPESLLRALEERRELLYLTLDSQQLSDRETDTLYTKVTCVPLIYFRSINSQQTLALSAQTDTVGVLYLDSRKDQTALNDLDRELLHTLAIQASTVLENAKLLEEEQQRLILERQLVVAREIQQSLLPRTFPRSGWIQAAGFNLASEQVSGDLYDVRPAGGDAWSMLIADVSGKGVSSALLASLLQGAFLLASELDLPLAQLLTKINLFITERTQREKYATLFYAVLSRWGEMVWANAGHCAPLLLRSTGDLEELRSTGMPLGLVADAHFDEKRILLLGGDKVILFSDGLTEAENRAGERFDSKLISALRAISALDCQQICETLLQNVREFLDGQALQDDATLLVVEFHGD